MTASRARPNDSAIGPSSLLQHAQHAYCELQILTDLQRLTDLQILTDLINHCKDYELLVGIGFFVYINEKRILLAIL